MLSSDSVAHHSEDPDDRGAPLYGFLNTQQLKQRVRLCKISAGYSLTYNLI